MPRELGANALILMRDFNDYLNLIFVVVIVIGVMMVTDIFVVNFTFLIIFRDHYFF